MTPVKLALNIVGVIAVVLGFVGIFLPLLPTTPFLLLASACFLRGSTRMHRWLHANPTFGKLIRDFENERAISRRAKIVALTTMWISLISSMVIVQSHWLQAMLAIVGVGVTIYLLRLKTLAPEE